jgi:hypothetical protein
MDSFRLHASERAHDEDEFKENASIEGSRTKREHRNASGLCQRRGNLDVIVCCRWIGSPLVG